MEIHCAFSRCAMLQNALISKHTITRRRPLTIAYAFAADAAASFAASYASLIVLIGGSPGFLAS